MNNGEYILCCFIACSMPCMASFVCHPCQGMFELMERDKFECLEMKYDDIDMFFFFFKIKHDIKCRVGALETLYLKHLLILHCSSSLINYFRHWKALRWF